MTLQIWTEKYRPKKLSEIKGQENIIPRLKSFVEQKNMPHLLFSGPAGVGKTSAALAVARELYGDTWKDHVLELNASDSRGIEIVRGQIKDFARTKAVENVPFKIVHLDESDALTQEAQHALRRTMEDYVAATRFILSANYSSKIIPAIQSRCAVFRFKPLPKDIAILHLKSIVQNEGLTSDVQSLEFIYEVSEGDMRKAENILQACASIEKNITLKVVNQVVSFAEPQAILEVLKLALSGQFLKAKTLLTDVIIEHGLSGLDAIKQIQAQIWNLTISERQKVELIKSCGEYEFRLVEGSNEFIQLSAMLAKFCLIGVTEK